MADDLATTLMNLHKELSQNPKLEPKTLEALRLLVGDIQRVVDSQCGEDAEEPSQPSDQTLGERLTAIIEGFEKEHPQLTQTLSMVAERLADMGI